MPQFKIEQIALCPVNNHRAIEFLAAIGLNEWFHDNVNAKGNVFGDEGENDANLAFNYQAGNGNDPAGKPLELEVLNYTDGPNWMDSGVQMGDVSEFCGAVSHLGMHVTNEELTEFHKVMERFDIGIAQEVVTQSHTNPAIKDSRRYKYVIYDTRELLSVDLKFIVRLPYTPAS